MRQLILLVITLFVFTSHAYAQNLCAPKQSFATVISDKFTSFYDLLTPILLQDPGLTIKFHLWRSESLYKEAVTESLTNPGEAMKLAIRGQNHLTLLEESIRKIQNQKEVPFTEILSVLDKTAPIQTKLATSAPRDCSDTVISLMSFEKRTDINLKKLYYESLLP